MARIVVALGGNALGNDPQTQQKHVDIAADIISSLVLMEMKCSWRTETVRR